MALSIRVDGLDASGIEVLSPTRPEFDELARPLLVDRIADLALRLKPMLVIVSNNNVRTVVSLSLAWNVTHSSGRTTRFWSHTSFPHVICGDRVLSDDPAGIETGQRRIEANGLVIQGWGRSSDYFDQFLGQFIDEKDTLLANAVHLHIQLNAVIFEDGLLVGPDDDSLLTDLFSSYVRSKQNWYRSIIESLDRGQSVAESFAPVERFLTDVHNRLQAGIGPKDQTPADMWTHNAAAEAKRWRRRYPDDDIPRLLKHAIRLEPFIIRR